MTKEHYPDHRCYEIGPTLAPGERPWPCRWEHDEGIDRDEDNHDHEWECCLIPHSPQSAHMEEVVRCRHCHVPRCGHSTDEDPCIFRRHHKGDHITCSEWKRLGRRLDARVLPMIHAHNMGRDVSSWRTSNE